MNNNNFNFVYDFYMHHELVLPKEQYNRKGLTGLCNLGNKCFINSIFQCLCNTLKLTDYFLSRKYCENDPHNFNKRKKEYFFINSYIELLINTWDHNQVLKPKSFNENISKLLPKYLKKQQQDSHECLLDIIDILHKGLSYAVIVEISGDVKNKTDLLFKNSIEYWKTEYSNNYSYIIELFNGMTINTIDCNKCEYSDAHFESFNTLSIDLTSNNLEECLNDYFKNEYIDTYKCSKCQSIGCIKNTKLWNLPNYIIINLKRFNYNGEKIHNHIDFPLKNLDLTKYILKDKNDTNTYLYNCYAINYHSGDARSGHYFSACKNLNETWYTFNDADVSQENILTHESPYILFYHRVFFKN